LLVGQISGFLFYLLVFIFQLYPARRSNDLKIRRSLARFS
jgi:hypothetical protein